MRTAYSPFLILVDCMDIGAFRMEWSLYSSCLVFLLKGRCIRIRHLKKVLLACFCIVDKSR